MGNKEFDKHFDALDKYVERTFQAWLQDYLHYTMTYGLKPLMETHGSTHGSTSVRLAWLNKLDEKRQATSFEKFSYGDTEEFFVSRAFDPYGDTGRAKNIVIHLVGANGVDTKPHIVNPQIDGKPAVDAIIVTPKIKMGKWQRPPPAWIIDFARDFHNDGWRVSLLGWSRGAYWTQWYVRTEPNIFCGAIIMGGYPRGSPEDFPAQANVLLTTGVPVMVMHALKDEFCQKELYEPWLRQLDVTARAMMQKDLRYVNAIQNHKRTEG